MRDVSGRHGERRAEDPRQADQRRPRRHDARAAGRVRGLLQLSVGRASSRAGSSVASPHQNDGGWVNDSEPEAEFQETVNKSMALLKAVALAETFAKET
jgi:hypothetical protein